MKKSLTSYDVVGLLAKYALTEEYAISSGHIMTGPTIVTGMFAEITGKANIIDDTLYELKVEQNNEKWSVTYSSDGETLLNLKSYDQKIVKKALKLISHL